MFELPTEFADLDRDTFGLVISHLNGKTINRLVKTCKEIRTKIENVEEMLAIVEKNSSRLYKFYTITENKRLYKQSLTYSANRLKSLVVLAYNKSWYTNQLKWIAKLYTAVGLHDLDMVMFFIKYYPRFHVSLSDIRIILCSINFPIALTNLWLDLSEQIKLPKLGYKKCSLDRLRNTRKQNGIPNRISIMTNERQLGRIQCGSEKVYYIHCDIFCVIKYIHPGVNRWLNKIHTTVDHHFYLGDKAYVTKLGRKMSSLK